jgi:tetratricopeptide (TPR) repeat protein
MNVYWMWRLAPLVELLLSWYGFLAFWVVATALSTLAELCLTGESPVGASGFVYALFGFRLLAGRSFPTLELDPVTFRTFVAWFSICLGLSYAEILPLANGTHIGGFIVGCLIAYGFINREERWAHLLTGIVLALLFIPCFYAPWQSNWNLARAMTSYDKQNYAQAIEYLDKSYDKNRASIVLEIRAWSDNKLGKYQEAIESFKILLTEVDPKQIGDPAEAMNGYAWLLATCPDEKLRNAADAIHYAEQACQETGYQDPAYLDTLAAAHAAGGNFSEAIKWEQKAVDIDKDKTEVEDLKTHLKAFQENRALKESL